jgi:pSer/pThr/pTyr-binding forkhead associated (FHA) protein
VPPFAPQGGPPLPPPFSPEGSGPNAAASARILRGFLVAYQSNPNGDFWPLHAGRHVVGRANSGDGLDIPLADATISSRHAALVVDANAGITVEDTGSTNGTYVNDEHIGMNGRRELKDGDRVRFGGFTTVVKIVPRM